MRIGQLSVVNFLSQLTASVIGFLATIYLARELGADVLGIYFLVIAVVIWLKIAGSMGIQTAVKKRLSERGDGDRYLAAGAIMVFVTFLIISAGLVIARGPVTEYLRGVPVLVVIPLLFGALLFSYVSAVLDGQHLVHVSAVLDPLDRLVRSAVQIAAVVIGFALGGLLFGYALGVLIAAVVGLRFIHGQPTIPRRKDIADLADFARFSWLNSLSSRAFASMDTLVLGLFVAEGLIGIYEISWNLASILAVFGISISRAVFPTASELSSDDRVDEVSGLVTDSLRYVGLLLIPGFVGALIIGGRVLGVYGNEFTMGYTVLIVLVLARLLHVYATPFVTSLNALDRPDLAFRADSGLVVTNVGLNFVLVYLYGWIGAAIATTASACVALVIGYRGLNRLTEVTLPFGAIIRQWTAALVMGVTVYGAQTVLPSGLSATIVLVSLGAAVYLGALYGISSDFRATVQSNLTISR